MRTLLCKWMLLLAAAGAPVGHVWAQSAQQLLRQAEKALKNGQLREAAPLLEQAARKEALNTDALFRAAECYYRLREYAQAARCYQEVPDVGKRDELAGLRYARAVKQSGHCDRAVLLFREFARQYAGSRRAQVLTVIQNEIKGCEGLGGVDLAFRDEAFDVRLSLMPAAVNSRNNELAPIPFTDQLLYFSVVDNNRVRFLRSIRENKVWQEAEPATGLPASLQARYGSGAFSPDGKRFYFTQCADGGSGACAIYILYRNGDSWSEPEALPKYINLPGSTSIHPFVAQQDEQEWLYFVSDRAGGFGGLDLYRCARPLASEKAPFHLPKNLGAQINTAADEVTPFFDTFTRSLWFSSNGQVTLGGLDIFRSRLEDGAWMAPENAGVPLNSAADDLFFVKKKSGKGGYLVSNREFGADKPGTGDQDIFEFLYNER